MNLLNDIVKEVTICRHKLHQNPATAFEEVFASNLIVSKLTEWGIEFTRGWAKTGIVATIHGKTNTSGKSIGLRADIDALNITEDSGQEWSSQINGKMHACSHDGHTAILLGTARYLQQTRNFNGTVHLFFQPAEEGGGGAYKMIEEGLFEKHPVDSVYAVHNWPYSPRGIVKIKSGPIMASSDEIVIEITGKGGHAAIPQECVDPIIVASEIVMSLQTIISRNVPTTDSAVITITNFNAGTGASNVIPTTAKLEGTVRTLSNEIRELIETRIGEVVMGICTAHGASATYEYLRNYDPTVNDHKTAAICAQIATDLFGASAVMTDFPPSMGAEDFGAMLSKKPGCYALFGQSVDDDLSPHNYTVHNPKYDFNDEIIPDVIRYFVAIAEKTLVD